MRSSISVVVVHLLCILPTSSQVRAEWVRVLDGPVARVAASSGHVAAVRGGEVWILRDDGTVLARLAAESPELLPAKDAGGDLRQADAILDVAGVSESDRDSDWAIDLLDDERTLAERQSARARPASGQISSVARPSLTASRTAVWIAHRQAWFRVDASGQVVRESRGRVARAWAAADGQLLVARADALALLSSSGQGERFLPLPSPADRVAVSATGEHWAWSGAAGTNWSDGASTDGLPPGAPAVDLAYCGETLLVLLPDVLLAVAPGENPEVRVRSPRAHRVVCPSSGAAPWLALGRQLSVSFDGGRSWDPVAVPHGQELVDVAATAHHLWLATRSGLYLSAPAGSAAPPPAMPPPRRGPRRHSTAWWSWLPRVSVRAATTRGLGERTFEALAFAQFALDRPAAPVSAASTESSSDSPPPGPAERSIDLRDADWACLGRVRRKAVEMAMAEPGRAQSYVTRAGRAAWLPELRVLVARRYGRSESLDVATSSTALSSPLGIDTVNDIRYEARATWDLAKLIFSTEELAAQNQALHMAELRRDIESTVNRLYFERRRLAFEGRGSGRAQPLRASEIEAELDALSGGAFGACLAEDPQRPESR
jgi:hypothetical protein